MINILGAMTMPTPIEVVRLLYSEGMFTPNIFMRLFILIQVFLPLLDFATDWFTSGSFHFTKLSVRISLLSLQTIEN